MQEIHIPSVVSKDLHAGDPYSIFHWWLFLKPIEEKIRRDRINASIDKLKTSLCQQMKEMKPSLKLEKADILEVTVQPKRQEGLQQLSTGDLQLPVSTHPSATI
uniref:BHLH domain-containing protein n=1 Tax=Paramormyrops kingsleyae TaxID=1676925 RepID=A0A3B3SY53_9TELE